MRGTFVILGGRTPERVCHSKVAFRSKAAVRRKALHIQSSGGQRFGYYQCWVCGMWHLTTGEGER